MERLSARFIGLVLISSVIFVSSVFAADAKTCGQQLGKASDALSKYKDAVSDFESVSRRYDSEYASLQSTVVSATRTFIDYDVAGNSVLPCKRDVQVRRCERLQRLRIPFFNDCNALDRRQAGYVNAALAKRAAKALNLTDQQARAQARQIRLAAAVTTASAKVETMRAGYLTALGALVACAKPPSTAAAACSAEVKVVSLIDRWAAVLQSQSEALVGSLSDATDGYNLAVANFDQAIADARAQVGSIDSNKTARLNEIKASELCFSIFGGFNNCPNYINAQANYDLQLCDARGRASGLDAKRPFEVARQQNYLTRTQNKIPRNDANRATVAALRADAANRVTQCVAAHPGAAGL